MTLPWRTLGNRHVEGGPLAKAGSFDGVSCTEEPIKHRLIAKDPDDNGSSSAHHTTGDQNHAIHETSKLHANGDVAITLQVQHHGEP
ncbi:MAG TPA: hypothetical protein PKK23_06555 [Nitrospirales bacterium]|nr:hypothetical protein [Nitrospirales bacterium]